MRQPGLIWIRQYVAASPLSKAMIVGSETGVITY